MVVSTCVLPAALLYTVVSIVSSVLILGIISKMFLAAISLVTFVCMVMDVEAITGAAGCVGTCVRRWELGEVAGRVRKSGNLF